MRLIITLAIICTYFSSNVFSQGFEVNPMKLYFNSSNTNQNITITNLSDTETQFAIFLKDYTKDSAGTLQLLPSDSLNNSCANFISFIPALINLDANSSKTITIQYNLDSLLRWGMLIIKPINYHDSLNSEKGQIRIFPQIAVKLFCNNKINESKLYSLSEIKKNDSRYSILLENKNKYFQQYNIAIIATDIKTLKEYEIKKISTEFLPNSGRKINFSLPNNLKKGKYSLAFILNDENQKFLAGKDIIVNFD